MKKVNPDPLASTGHRDDCRQDTNSSQVGNSPGVTRCEVTCYISAVSFPPLDVMSRIFDHTVTDVPPPCLQHMYRAREDADDFLARKDTQMLEKPSSRLAYAKRVCLRRSEACLGVSSRLRDCIPDHSTTVRVLPYSVITAERATLEVSTSRLACPRRLRGTLRLLRDESDNSPGQEILDTVFRHLNLLETAYFGLRYLDASNQTKSAVSCQSAPNKSWGFCSSGDVAYRMKGERVT
uniref:FERM domain-containing protein n=1 Tax=Timema shepardi TaxID=629360 RepID=A0A7R9ALK4_TIMSH|nr:unnamed protein product [Timema shepardi]